MSADNTNYYCIVPMCTNTGVTAPDKQFIAVPRNAVVRKKWCVAMKRCEKRNIRFLTWYVVFLNRLCIRIVLILLFCIDLYIMDTYLNEKDS